MQTKINKLIQQSEKEKAAKEKEERATNVDKAKSDPSENGDEKAKTETSISSPPSKIDRKESRTEAKSEKTRSQRSSISNLSTADSSLKKDLMIDQKEDFDIKLSPKSENLEHKGTLSKHDDNLEPEDTRLSRYQSEEKKAASSEEGIVFSLSFLRIKNTN